MYSLYASLRSLTLPNGVTSGKRIFLNGVLGEITLYNDNDFPVGNITAQTGSDPSAGPEMSVSAESGATAGIYADLDFALHFTLPPDSGTSENWAESQLLADTFLGQPYTEWNSPESQDVPGYSRIQLFGQSNSAPDDLRIRFEAANAFDFAGGGYIALERGGVFRFMPIEIGYQATTTDSATFTATTTVDSFTVPVQAGLTYDVIWDGQYGSSVAGDVIQTSLFVGATSLRRSRLTLPRNIDPWPIRHCGRYTAVTTGNQTFNVVAVRAAGTGNITRYGTSANGGPAIFQVLEVG